MEVLSPTYVLPPPAILRLMLELTAMSYITELTQLLTPELSPRFQFSVAVSDDLPEPTQESPDLQLLLGDRECPLCLDAFLVGDQLVRAAVTWPCGHHFHKSCSFAYLYMGVDAVPSPPVYRSTCPYCRYEITHACDGCGVVHCVCHVNLVNL